MFVINHGLFKNTTAGFIQSVGAWLGFQSYEMLDKVSLFWQHLVCRVGKLANVAFTTQIPSIIWTSPIVSSYIQNGFEITTYELKSVITISNL